MNRSFQRRWEGPTTREKENDKEKTVIGKRKKRLEKKKKKREEEDKIDRSFWSYGRNPFIRAWRSLNMTPPEVERGKRKTGGKGKKAVWAMSSKMEGRRRERGAWEWSRSFQ